MDPCSPAVPGSARRRDGCVRSVGLTGAIAVRNGCSHRSAQIAACHPDDRGMPIGWMQPLQRVLPTGGSLPEGGWASRHRAILWIVGAHIAGLFVYALVTGHSGGQALAVVTP